MAIFSQLKELRRSSAFRQTQFDVLLIYYWIIQVLSFVWLNLDSAAMFIYLAVVIPILLFLVINLPAAARVMVDLHSPYFPLVVYVLLVSIVSIARLDFATPYNVAIFSFAILIILKNQFVVKLKLLNGLYLLTIAFCIYSYHAGINPYGYLPYHGVGEYYERGKSLFPYAIVGSAMFSLIVLMANFVYSKSRFRWAYILVGGYFVFLSFNRTTIICLFIFLGVVALAKFSEFQDRAFYKLLPAMVLSLFILFVFNISEFSGLLSSASRSESMEYLSSNRDMGTTEELSGSARPYMMSSQFALFLESPLIGVGTFTLDNAFGLSGRETFLTGLLARIGLLVVPFILFYVMQIKAAIVNRALLPYAVLIIMIIVMLTYGVIMVPYEFLFLLLIGLLNKQEPRPLPEKVKSLQTVHFPRQRLLRPL